MLGKLPGVQAGLVAFVSRLLGGNFMLDPLLLSKLSIHVFVVLGMMIEIPFFPPLCRSLFPARIHLGSAFFLGECKRETQ